MARIATMLQNACGPISAAAPCAGLVPDPLSLAPHLVMKRSPARKRAQGHRRKAAAARRLHQRQTPRA